ncbi:SFT-1 protein, partial [Aphelenchoides avenae]
VYRLRWKLDIVKHLQDQLEAPAVPFPVERVSEDPNLNDLEYRRVRIKGRFLYDRQFAIGPRTRFDKAYKQVPKGIISDNDTTSHGAHIITPFLLHGTDKIIMVNRGWVPRDDIHVELEKKKRRSGTVEIEAVVRKSEKRPQFVGENIPERGVWHYKDFDQMAQKCGALPVYMEAVYETTESGGPIGGQTNVNIRNEHLNYALTWFATSIVTMLMWYQRFVR